MNKKILLLGTLVLSLVFTITTVSFDAYANPLIAKKLIKKGASKKLKSACKKQHCVKKVKQTATELKNRFNKKKFAPNRNFNKGIKNKFPSTAKRKKPYRDNKNSPHSQRQQQTTKKSRTTNKANAPRNSYRSHQTPKQVRPANRQSSKQVNRQNKQSQDISKRAYQKHLKNAKPEQKNKITQIARTTRREKCKGKSVAQCDKLINQALVKNKLVKPKSGIAATTFPSQTKPQRQLAKIGNTTAPKNRAARANNSVQRHCCFVAGTQVLTQDGYKNIEQVELGELLWAKDVDTGVQDWKPVTKVFIEPQRNIYQIKLTNHQGLEQKIEATDDHPFYLPEQGWVETILLEPGDQIETDGHGPMTVASVIDQQRLDLTYNFTVADFHTYYVTKKNVLVHNCNKKRTGSSKNEAHGDGGRAATKAKEQLAQLTEQLKGAPKKEAKKIKQKIQNINRDIQRKEKGENHSMKKKGGK